MAPLYVDTIEKKKKKKDLAFEQQLSTKGLPKKK